MDNPNQYTHLYSAQVEGSLAEMLSHFESTFVFSVLDVNMKKRFEFGQTISSNPNIVNAWEENFNFIIGAYGPESVQEVTRVRNETYQEIIDTICKEFGLNFTIDDVDLYSSASILCDFLVNGFTKNLVTFFTTYIYRERNNLYDSLNLSPLKKNKDSSTIYAKKMYKDIKLAVISANIDTVVHAICGMDIPYDVIVSTIYGANSPIARHILSITSTSLEFFSKVYGSVLNSEVRAEILTSIRLGLQNIIMSNESQSDSIDEDDSEEETENE